MSSAPSSSATASSGHKVSNSGSSARAPDHPMDKIPIRQLRFEFNKTTARDPIWSRSKPDFSLFMNALGIHIPYFEHFLVKVMRDYRAEVISNKKLSADVKAIIGQESHHAYNFKGWTREMCLRYPGLEVLDTGAKKHFAAAAKEKDKKFKIGFTAGYETFTFLGGLIILQRFEEFMADADSDIRALWLWHQVEEVEHGAVAFDFYRAFYPESEWYRRYMVVYAFAHIIKETFKAYALMIRAEKRYAGFRRKLKAWLFFVKFGWDLGYSALPVLSSNYHPRNHPVCTSEQNQIAIAWRKHHAAGNDSHRLNDEVMRLLQQPQQQ